MAGRFSVEAVFKAVDRVTAPVSKMQNRVSKFTRSMERGFSKLNRNVDRFSSGMKKSAFAVTAALAGLSASIIPVIATGAEFEKTIVGAAAKFPGEIRKGSEAFKKLENIARETGSKTEFSASQSAQAINFLAMAGFNAKSAIAALPGVVDLATAAQVDLARATDVASDSLGSFGLMTQDSVQLGKNLSRVNDVIAKTTTSANTTIDALFETIKDGAPVATSVGASMETFAALAGELANAGIKGSRAGTTLKNMFLNLSAPSKQAAKILRSFGIRTQDASGDMRDIIDVLGDLNNSLDGLGSAKRAGVLEGIFGKIPIAGVNVLLASGSERLREFRDMLLSARGASSKMANTMRDTVESRYLSLKSAIEGVEISIFNMTEGPLSDVLGKMTQWVRLNEELIATNIASFLASVFNNMENIVNAGKKIAIVIASYIAFTSVIKAFTAVMIALNIIMAMNPIGLIVLGITSAIAAFSALVIWIDDVATAFDNLNPFVRAILAPLELVIRSIKFIKDAFRDGLDGAVTNLVANLGFGDDDQDTSRQKVSQTPKIISPGERVARSIDEQRTTSSAEVTIKDETGRAEVTGGNLGPGLSLQPSGSF